MQGVTTSGVDAALHRDQPHATIDAGLADIRPHPGSAPRTGPSNLATPVVTSRLTFTSTRSTSPAAPAAATAPQGRHRVREGPGRVHGRSVRSHVIKPNDTTEPPADVLVVIDALPWGSEALFNVLVG